MLNSIQREIVMDLIRRNSRMIRRDKSHLISRINALVEAGEAAVPDQFLLPFSSSLQKALEASRFDQSQLPSSVISLFNKNRHCGTENLASLEKFCTRVRGEFGASTEKAVLSGDGAALSGLYQDPGAYRGAHWAAVLPDGTCANGDKPKSYRPPGNEWSDPIGFGNAVWRRPKPVLLIALLAGHVGDPTISPDRPMWPHLGLAALVYKDRVTANQVLELAGELANRKEAERGLAIVSHIFPELCQWLYSANLVIPNWERKFALSFAAHKLVKGKGD
jgi:hypothetical protein